MHSASSGRRGDDVEATVGGSAPSNGGLGSQPGQVLRYCDFTDFVQHLGIDPRMDASGLIMLAAHQMFSSPLPPHWSEHIDESTSRVYFFDALTGDSLWIHPQEAVFRELIDEVRFWLPDDPFDKIFERINNHLRQAYLRATEAISQWSGPYDAPQGPEEAPEFGEASQFYYNSATGESRWSDPLQSHEYDLRQRHAILCQCMAMHTQNLAKMAPGSPGDESSAEEDESRRPSVQAFVQNLWESLGDLRLPSRSGSEPPSDAPPEPPQVSLQRPSYLPEGNDTVRSSMSYLTARSTGSCATEEISSPDGSYLQQHPFVLRPGPE